MARILANIASGLLGSACALALGVSAHAAGTPTFTTVYGFKGTPDGSGSTAPLTYHDGLLYGTTSEGGVTKGPEWTCFGGCGTLFSVDPVTQQEKILHKFATAAGDGISPSGLTYDNNGFYGTGYEGGDFKCSTYGCGVVFRVDAKTGAETILHQFAGGADGANPRSAPILVNGVLYGTTQAGGTKGSGTVYKIDLATGAEAVIYSFRGGLDGTMPIAGLTSAGGYLYGVTYGNAFGNGAAGQLGTIFRVDPATGSETVLHRFTTGSGGSFPFSGLTFYNGMLYGTTLVGGVAAAPTFDGGGTVFQIDPANPDAFATLYAFNGTSTDGRNPEGTLVVGHGKLLGTTVTTGGASAGPTGTVFSVDPQTGAERVLRIFTKGSGATLYGGLTYAKRAYFSTTFEGGPSGGGTVFKLSR